MRHLLSFVALLVATVPQRSSAQLLGLWEERDAVDGTAVRAPSRACRVGGATIAALQTWPANCVVAPLRRTASGMVSEARCPSGRTDMSLHLRRELSGDPERHFRIETITRVVGATTVQAAHRSTVALRYLGACPGEGSRQLTSAGAGQPALSREPLAIVALRIAALVAVLFGLIVAMGWFFRQRWRKARDRATVENIVTDAGGAATIPVLVTFTGVRGMPWWYAVAMNNAKPLLAVDAGGMCFRVVFRQRRSFDEVACVDVRQAPGTVNLDFTFHGSLFTFAANVGTTALAAHVIAMLPPGVPLSSRARALKASA